jgi:hypothetical protein
MKRGKIIFTAVYILALAASVLAAATSVEVTGETDKTQASLGDVIRYTLTVKRQGDMSQSPSVNMPSFEGFRVQGTYSNSMMNFINGAASATNQQIVDLIAVKSGEITIAPARVKFLDQSTKQYSVVQTKPITITVGSGRRHAAAAAVDTPIPQPTPAQQLQTPVESDIHKIKYSVHMDLSELLPYIILAIIFILAVYFIWKRIMKKPEIKTVVLEEDYRKEALRMIKKSADILKNGDIKGYYSDIYEAIRWFLTRRFKDSFEELTTLEILKRLDEKKGRGKDIEAASIVMKECDLVKFADYKPAEKDTREIAEAAERLITDFK